MTVYILGGGPTGLALAQGLSDAKITDFVLIEQGELLGGMAKSVAWDQYGSHDLGPHKIFTLDDALMNRVQNLIGKEDWLEQDKSSKIFMDGYYLPYPPSPFSLAKVYGLRTFIKMTLNYGIARLSSLFIKSNPRTFEEDILSRLGRGLYEALFKPIARKLWGSPDNLDVKLSKGRVQTPSLLEIIQLVLRLKRNSSFEALTFKYPRGGLQKLWDSIYNKTKSNGLYHLSSEVLNINVEQTKIKSLAWKDLKTGDQHEVEIGKGDIVVSTLPIGLMVKFMPESLGAEQKQELRHIVQLNDLLLVFLKIDKKRLLNESWVFVPDAKIPFHRLSEQASFDPGMVENGSIVCCEIMSNELRDMASKTDAELISEAEAGLHKMGYKGFQVQDSRVIRLPKSYPVYRPGYEPVLERILQYFDGIENFKTIGRHGAFNYIGTLDAMDIGYGCAKWIEGYYKENTASSWKDERIRTQHYPVLD